MFMGRPEPGTLAAQLCLDRLPGVDEDRDEDDRADQVADDDRI